MTASYTVGIDLGTTHTVVAWAPLDGSAPPTILSIPQLVGGAVRDERPLLPSVLYAPIMGELEGDPTWIAGEHARRRCQEVPGRGVVSAKSWLSHPRVDRTAPILPWGVDDPSVPHLSPVDASRRLLEEVRAAWDMRFPKSPLATQQVVLTVPASFDQVARELTLSAARSAGLTVRLLEEPQAAFYDHLSRGGEAELKRMLAGSPDPMRVLVCDVGGGTTDLTLIEARQSEAGIALERVAVGRHLLLGGDNIDLALARIAEQRLVPDQHLAPAQLGQLLLACRAAKEQLLGTDPPESAALRLLRSGSALVGNTLSTELTRAEVEALVLDGFFARVAWNEPLKRGRSGLIGLGLPYEADPVITRHVSAFLARTSPEVPRLAALLPNGGAFRARQVTARLREVLASWSGHEPVLLDNPEPDLSVARGAVVYGLAIVGRGLRIGSGSPQGFYVGVSGGDTKRAVCVVPRGAKEGERFQVKLPGLALDLGTPVRFELYAADAGPIHAPGMIVDADSDDFTRLPPIATSLAQGTKERVPVAIEGELSPVGTLDLHCVEQRASGAVDRELRLFSLAFEVRALNPLPLLPEGEGETHQVHRGEGETHALHSRDSRRSSPPLPSDGRGGRGVREVGDSAKEAILRVYGKGRKDVRERESKDLWRELERLLGERKTWSTELLRALFDVVAPLSSARRRSLDHERTWWMLAGFCLRPGFGHPLDPQRVSLLAPLLREGLAFPTEARGWQQHFVALRRIAAGLDEATQVELRDQLDPFLAPESLKLKKPKGYRPQAPDELLEVATWLERVPSERRADLGKWLLEQTWTSRDPRLWTGIGRIGARVPLYASVHHVVSPRVVERWVDHLLREKWEEVRPAAATAIQLCRVTDDRARDVAEALRREVANRLARVGVPAEEARLVREYVPIAAQEQAARFGDDLPVGLTLEGGGAS